jgi:hypothetical protein
MPKFEQVRPEGDSRRENQSDYATEQKGGKIKWLWFVIIAVLIIFYFVGLTSVFPEYKELSLQIAMVGTALLVLFWIFKLFINVREKEIKAKEKNVVVIASIHDFDQEIKSKALELNMRLGEFLGHEPVPYNDEAASAPTWKQGFYENLENEVVVGKSRWKVSLIKKPIIELLDREYVKRDSLYRTLGGQARTQPVRPLASTAASKKAKHKSFNIETQEERDEPSITE